MNTCTNPTTGLSLLVAHFLWFKLYQLRRTTVEHHGSSSSSRSTGDALVGINKGGGDDDRRHTTCSEGAKSVSINPVMIGPRGCGAINNNNKFVRLFDINNEKIPLIDALSSTDPRAELQRLLDKIDVFIFDCDGVIWKGDSLIEGAADALDYLRSLGKKVLFMTNNSSKSRFGFLKKFTSLGVTASEEEVFSSSFAVVAYLQKHPPPLPPPPLPLHFPVAKEELVYVIGLSGTCEELSSAGIRYIGGPEDDNKSVYTNVAGIKTLHPVVHDPNVTSVVVGLDTNINFYKIQYAQLCLNTNENCKFIATNMDKIAHLTKDQEWADGGAAVGCIAGSTDRAPVVVGKPSSVIIDHILEKYQLCKSRICMVGDRLDTDIVFGRDNGLITILTLSGVTSKKLLLSSENTIKPNYYTDSIADFLLHKK